MTSRTKLDEYVSAAAALLAAASADEDGGKATWPPALAAAGLRQKLGGAAVELATNAASGSEFALIFGIDGRIGVSDAGNINVYPAEVKGRAGNPDGSKAVMDPLISRWAPGFLSVAGGPTVMYQNFRLKIEPLLINSAATVRVRSMYRAERSGHYGS